jgi:hypothetical protein
MSNQKRALVIGMLGPAISGLGLIWAFAKSLLQANPDQADFRYLLFDSPHLVIAVGIVVSFVCLPIALGVILASEEALEIPVFDEVIDDAADAPPEAVREPVGG